MERAGRFVYILSLWYTSDEISILMHALYRDFLRQCSVHQNGRLAKHTKTKKDEALEKNCWLSLQILSTIHYIHKVYYIVLLHNLL